MQQAANLNRRALNVYERMQSRMHTYRHILIYPAYSLDYFTLASTPKEDVPLLSLRGQRQIPLHSPEKTHSTGPQTG